MTALQPQTIVIKTLTTRTPTTLTINSQLEHDMLDDLYGDGGTKKRRRLTHLSTEEKLLRRKLKNRVAAQTARDRKKNIMGELEQKVAELERQNRKLALENQALKSESGTLHRQNEHLKERLGVMSCASSKTEVGIRSAVSTDLQQQGQAPSVSYLTNAASLVTLSLTLLLASSQRATPNKSRLRLSQRLSRPSPYQASSANRRPTRQIPTEWWGPQQQSWNPSKN